MRREAEVPFAIAAMEGETRYVNSGGLSLAYQVFGEGSCGIVIPMPFISHLDHSWEWP